MKKEKIIKYVAVLIVVIIIAISIFIIIKFKNNNKKDDNLNEKTQEELKYISTKIIELMNGLNNITFSNYILIEEENTDNKENNSNENNENEGNKSNENNENEGNKSDENNENEGNKSDTFSDKSNNTQSSSESNIKYELKGSNILSNNTGTINWDNEKGAIESINVKWTSLIVDLHQLNVNNDDILNFSNILNQTIVNIKQENKVNTMLNLANLYGYIPNYLKQFSNDEEKIIIEYIKSNILNSYALVEQERWDEVKEHVFNSVENITNIMNSINTEQFSQYQINRIYVMLNELYSSIDLKDKQLYYIKYRNVMEELMNI